MITIAICTYNNADSLSITLESLRHLYCPEELKYEILVVDNNSNDRTHEVVKQYVGIFKHRLRYVFEGQQGLSHARNRALKDAESQIVSFIDDDVKVDQRWLEAIANAFEKYSASVVGGKSYLIFPGKKPEWLSPRIETMLSRLDYGDEALVDTDNELFGLNFSVMRSDALSIGGFNTNFGRCGKSLSSGEETDFLKRIRKNGGIAVYEPSAIVGHIIPPERLTKKWFFKRYFEGFASVERLSLINGGRPDILNNLYHLFRSSGSIIKSIIKKGFNSQEFFLKLCNVFRMVGVVKENIIYFIRLFRKNQYISKL